MSVGAIGKAGKAKAGGSARAGSPGKRGATLRGVAAAAKRRSIKSEQGCALPEHRSPIGVYPNKCCVLIEVDGRLAWHMIVFRIGNSGPPHVSQMANLPSSTDWNTGMGASRSVPEDTVVLDSCWPYRPSAPESTEGESSGDDDPLASRPVEGALMFDHLRSVRDAAPTRETRG